MQPTRVTLHVPSGEGRFLEARKFTTVLRDTVRTEDSGAIFCERAGDDEFVTRVSAEGDVAWRVDVPDDSAQRLVSSADGTRAYVLSKEHALALDARSGAVIGDFKTDKEGYGRRLLPQADGRVALLDGSRVRWMDADLHETSVQEMPWEVRGLRVLSGGGMVVQGPNDYYHLGNHKVFAKDGRELFSTEQVRPVGLTELSDGRVAMIQYTPRFDDELVILDPSSGAVTRQEAPRDSRSIFPQKDGTSILFGRGYDDISSSFRQLGPDGSVLRSWTFEREGAPRNFLMDAARNQAFVVIRPNDETIVKRLDLAGPTGECTATVVYQGPGNAVVPPVFEDGRLAVFAADGIHVFGGESEARYASIGEFRGAAGDVKLQDNMALGESPFLDRADLSAWLGVAAKWVNLPDRREYIDPKVGPGFTVTADRCVNFAHEVSSAEAIVAMRLPDESVYQRMVMSRPDQSVVIGDVGRELGFPDGASVNVGRGSVTWQLPGQEAQENKYVDVLGALPVKAGDDYFIALAEHANGTERLLTWCHPGSKTYEHFDASGKITGLYGGDAVYAVGSNGSVLMLEPPLAEGQRVESRVQLPRSVSEPAAEGGASSGKVTPSWWAASS